jgi:hypothetical protein
MAADSVFRYLAILPPRRPSDSARLVAVDVDRAQSAFIARLAALRAAGAPEAELAEASRRHQATEAFTAPLAPGFESLPQLIAELGGRPVLADGLVDEAVRTFRLAAASPAAALRAHLESDAGRATRVRLVEGILSLTHSSSGAAMAPDEWVSALKTLDLLHSAASGRWPFPSPLALDDAIQRMTAVIPGDLARPRRAPPDPASNDRPSPELDPGLAATHAKMAHYGAAIEELARPGVAKGVEPGPGVVRASVGEPATPEKGVVKSGASRRAAGVGAPQVQPLASEAIALRLAPSAFDKLTPGARAALEEVGFTRENTSYAGAVQALEHEMQRLQERVSESSPARMAVLVGQTWVPVSGLKPRASPPYAPTLDPDLALTLSCPYYAGHGELRIVKQELIAYELADIAHIENVLAGEEKRRTHRRLDRTEEVERELSELITETERDLQSTDRFELETEAQRTAQTAAHVEGGVTVSGSYGPTVSFTANASAGFSYQTSTSSRRAARFAQEVVERSIERVKERVETERRVTRVREIEETNRHALLNAAAGARNVRGVYRWLNKIYRAQVYTYGARHMFEFVVPEPAAFYLWSLAQPEASPIAIPMLPPPDFGPSGVDIRNWYVKAAEYGAQGVEPPPPHLVYVAYTSDKAANDLGRHSFSQIIKVPDGYEAFAAVWNVARTSVGGDADARGLLQIHKNQIYVGKADASGYMPFLDGEYVRGDVGVAFNDWNYYSYSISVNLLCIRTLDHYNKWKLDVFTAIMDAYRDYEADRQAREAQASIGEGISVPGRNPAVNQRIMRDELQRSCLSILTGTDLDQFDGFAQSGEPLEWRINPPRARQHGREAQFLQNAFEWENMTYVFYPYFYGRGVDRWIQNVHHTDDPDPLFGAFLRAGMARVQVPVRPGFEAVVARYCQDGVLWAGDDPPLIGDDLHVPIIDEIKRGLDAPDGGEPSSDPWEVRVPTSLVLLEDAANLQGFRDPLFGRADGSSGIEFDPPEASGSSGGRP